jgi:hypothetical protein
VVLLLIRHALLAHDVPQRVGISRGVSRAERECQRGKDD